jgi:hypothetical protein
MVGIGNGTHERFNQAFQITKDPTAASILVLADTLSDFQGGDYIQNVRDALVAVLNRADSLKVKVQS